MLIRPAFSVAVRALAALPAFAAPATAQTVPATAPSGAPERPRIIPSADFARDAPITSPLLSPDGTRIAARAMVDGKLRVALFDMTGSGARPITLAIPKDSDLRWYGWAGNGRLLISLARTVPWFDDEAEMTRLYQFDIATQQFALVGSKSAGLEGDDLLYVDPDGAWVLLSFQATPYDYPSVTRIELATNKMTRIVAPRTDVWEWYSDGAGVVRAGIGWGTTRWTMVYRSKAADKFRVLGRVEHDDEDAALDIMRLARDSDEGFVLSNKETGRYALYRFNFATKTLGEKVLDAPENDITDFQTTEDGTRLRAAWFTDDRDRIVWYDPALKKVQAEIDGAIKSNENWIVSRRRATSPMPHATG